MRNGEGDVTETVIAARVGIDCLDPIDVRVVIRKVDFGQFPDGKPRVIVKYGLSRSGEWIVVSEGQRYPDECLLPVAITDNTTPPMLEAKLFLEEITKAILPGEGQRHSLTVEGENLVLTLMLGERYQPIVLTDDDLDGKSGEELIEEVKDWLVWGVVGKAMDGNLSG